VVDLDGPILDPSEHHYACYRGILTDQGYGSLPKDRYWRLKRAGAGTEAILACSGCQAAEPFRAAFVEQIERSEFLALDRIQPGAPETLARWRSEGRRVILATLRREREALFSQLERTGLAGLFDAVVQSDQRNGATGKAALAWHAGARRPGSCLWIGDAEIDIAAARVLGSRIWAVTCGLRSAQFLAGLAPDFIGPSLATVDLTAP
jgi:phosphoglycolate phosphatase